MTNNVERIKSGGWIRIGKTYNSGWRIYTGEDANILDKLFGVEGSE